MSSVYFTKDEIDILVNDLIGSRLMSLDDEEEIDIDYAKKLNKIEMKIVRSLNRRGIWYKCHLIDVTKPVSKENIKEEWL